MAYTYDELHKKTVEELRGIAKNLQHEAVQGYTQMNKEHLLPALCKVLGVDIHVHHKVVGIDKPALKKELRQLKAARNQALGAHDSKKLKEIRRKRHKITRSIRAHYA